MAFSNYMSQQDHYKVLAVPGNASLEQVKKAYRKLALEFHPDKNASAIAAMQFRAVQEAYIILSDPKKRRAFDNERWLNGSRESTLAVVSGAALISKFVALAQQLQKIDTYHMDHKVLHDYIYTLLGDENCAFINAENNPTQQSKIINLLINTTAALKYKYVVSIINRAQEKLELGTDNKEKLNTYLLKRKKQYQYLTAKPFIILAVAILLCCFMMCVNKDK